MKEKQIGRYKITQKKEDSPIWVTLLPFMEDLREFLTWEEAEKYVKNKMKEE